MDQTSFQNGFICGMATKGLFRSGELYKPTIYNDSGVYSYFYIDFRRTLQDFSLGMFNESIIVFDNQQIPVTQIEQCSPTVFKVYCSLTGLIHGVTVLNKKTSRLKFTTGEVLPVFSTHMFISGHTSYSDGAYICERPSVKTQYKPTSIVETVGDLSFAVSRSDSEYESLYASTRWFGSLISETPTVLLT